MDRPSRIFGIDWLEMYVNECPSVDYSAEGFEQRGWWVQRRDYGTVQMAEMFVLLDKSANPFIEIRRKPRAVGKDGKKTVYDQGDSYIRLTNLYCYDYNPMKLMTDFLEREKYTIKKIYRIDLYMDIVKFDTGDIPKKVARRIVNHTYAKVNQTKRRTNGDDTWTECFEDWISWGAKGSMVSTKFYNKTKELKDTGMHKTYIVENWRRHGIVDNVIDIMMQGAPVEVWRLEFSIKGNAKGWIYIDKSDSEDGRRHVLPHNPAVYADRQGVLNAIANLIPYYFKFRVYREGVKKSNCKEKILFQFTDDEVEKGYRLTSESDIDRVRAVQVDDDIIALKHLSRAATLLYGSQESKDIVQITNRLRDKVSAKSSKSFDKFAEIWG